MHYELTLQLDYAVAEVLAVMHNLVCIPVYPYPRGDISALVASVIFSGSLDGICTIELDHCAAASLTSDLIGLPPAQISPDLCADTAGELCNMIAGCWKSSQSHALDHCHISCPIVTTGEPAGASGFQQSIARLYRFADHHFALTLSFN